MSNKLKKKSRPLPKRANPTREAQFQEALAAHQAGLLPEASARYQSILAADPHHAASLNMLSLIAQQEGDFAQAVLLARRAVASRAESSFLSNLGSAYRGLHKLPEAIAAFQHALRLNPDHPQAQFNLASTLLDAGDLAAAGKWFEKLLIGQPKMIPAREGLGRVLLGQGDFPAAKRQFEAILALTPQHSNAQILRGLCLQNLQQPEEALLCYREALRQVPGHGEALNNIGNILAGRGEFHAALDYYRQAVAAVPDFLAANINLAWALLQHGMIREALTQYRTIIELRPDLPEVYSDFLFSLNYDPEVTPAASREAATLWWQRFAPREPLPEATSRDTNSADLARRASSDKLRLGLLSPDFRNHPVGTFLLPLLSELTTREVEVFCYAEIEEQFADETTAQIKGMVHSWHQTCRQDNIAVARRIQADRLDILIDLAGHSGHNRLGVLALKPAPRQASWLGYVNTTGLPVVDFRVTDAVVDPPGAENHYCESLIRLPHGFFCYSPPAEAPPVSPLPARRAGRFTLGSFNNLAKINEQVVATWAQILRRIPNSQLLMVGKPLGDRFIAERYTGLFVEQGVEPEQLRLVASLPMQEYLALHNEVDLALDPFPHNGHTITCHTLWMGVPVLVLRGNRYAGRMGASILTRIGLEELIAATPAHYVDLACQLAADLDQLATLRAGMRQRLLNSPMCDRKQFGDDFLQALRAMSAPN